MPKKNKEQKDEKIKELFKQIKKMNLENEEDLANIEALLEEIIVEKNSIKRKIFLCIKSFLARFILFYMLCLIVFGLFFSSLVLENRYSIFYIGIGISAILAFFEILPFLNSNRHFFFYVFLLIMLVLDFCLINNAYPIFEHSSSWIFFFIMIGAMYLMTVYVFLKKAMRKFKGD